MYILKCLKFILDSFFVAKNENCDCRLYAFVYNLQLGQLNVIFLGVHCTYRVCYVCSVN